MSNIPSVKASELLNIDTEEISYLLMDALDHSNSVGSFCDYVESKDWSKDKKMAVCLCHGVGLCRDETVRTTWNVIFADKRLQFVLSSARVNANSPEELKMNYLTTIDNAQELVNRATELNCELTAFVGAGMLIALM